MDDSQAAVVLMEAQQLLVSSCPVVCPPCPACPSGGTCDPNDSPVFVDNGDSTVTDTRTSLIWLQNADCNGADTQPNQIAWANGLQDGDCDLSDGSTAGQWRLPTVTELQDLIDYSQNAPALPVGWATYFNNVQGDFYWTSTNFAANPNNRAWMVGLGSGRISGDGKTNTHYAWAVR